MDNDKISAGKIATIITAELSGMVRQREEDIIQRLIGEYRDGRLTDASMRSAIAGIAELRFLMQDLHMSTLAGLQEEAAIRS